jgi:pre-mRNA-splicing factor SYF1
MNVAVSSAQALPITQHHRLWPMYLKFVGQHNIPETAVRVWRRYLKLEAAEVEDYIDYLKRVNRLDEAAQKLADVVNDVCCSRPEPCPSV